MNIFNIQTNVPTTITLARPNSSKNVKIDTDMIPNTKPALATPPVSNLILPNIIAKMPNTRATSGIPINKIDNIFF